MPFQRLSAAANSSGSRVLLVLAGLISSLAIAPLAAQGHKPSFYDLTTVRNRPWAVDNWIEVRVGGLMNFAQDENEARYKENDFVPYGSFYYRQRDAIGRENRIDFYAGIDGLYGSITEGDPQDGKAYSRLEVEAKQWAGYQREGHYEGDDFVPSSIYEQAYWKARLSFATHFGESIIGEIGPFYGRHSFSRSEQTPFVFTLPDSHQVYGVHLRAEDNTLQYDRRTLLPQAGYIASIWVEREWNDSDAQIGLPGTRAELPDSVWRGGGHLEYYIPYTENGAFIVQADGAWAAEDDRLYIHDTRKPVGELWVDARLDYRLLIGSKFTFTPGIRGQYIKLHDEFFRSSDAEFFFGFQLEGRVDFSESFAISLEYSYLQNPSRESFSLDEDLLGEHRLFFGIEFRP